MAGSGCDDAAKASTHNRKSHDVEDFMAVMDLHMPLTNFLC